MYVPAYKWNKNTHVTSKMTKVACSKVLRGGRGVVVGCDLLNVDPVDGAEIITCADFTEEATQAKARIRQSVLLLWANLWTTLSLFYKLAPKNFKKKD